MHAIGLKILLPLDQLRCNNAWTQNCNSSARNLNILEIGMWIEKLVSGVLRVLTPLGPRYLKPSFAQRLYLLWVFRNFETLPAKVLTSRQHRFIENLYAQDRFVSFGIGVNDAPLLGTLEQRPAVSENVSRRRPAESVNDGVRPFVADVRRQ